MENQNKGIETQQKAIERIEAALAMLTARISVPKRQVQYTRISGAHHQEGEMEVEDEESDDSAKHLKQTKAKRRQPTLEEVLETTASPRHHE
ncbi:hypothetical protein [Janthinobacterium sp.]|uniref:hypothetical protein n=1 Tax=Janthinobacterium sp. TaxID=1871054 RepID=UPI00293D3C99|nr:hypothetical protein [Janthinobacterium sp.]